MKDVAGQFSVGAYNGVNAIKKVHVKLSNDQEMVQTERNYHEVKKKLN